MTGKEVVLFLKKKNEKDSFEFGPWAPQNPGSKVTEVFAPLFSNSGIFLKEIDLG
jgi:hypothetical protein